MQIVESIDVDSDPFALHGGNAFRMRIMHFATNLPISLKCFDFHTHRGEPGAISRPAAGGPAGSEARDGLPPGARLDDSSTYHIRKRMSRTNIGVLINHHFLMKVWTKSLDMRILSVSSCSAGVPTRDSFPFKDAGGDTRATTMIQRQEELSRVSLSAMSDDEAGSHGQCISVATRTAHNHLHCRITLGLYRKCPDG